MTRPPRNPVSRSICEKYESALASVKVIFCAPSTPWSDEATRAARLCFSSRAGYAFPPTVTACVLHRTVTPDASTQSKINSGVGGVCCSLNWSMVGMLSAFGTHDLNHCVVNVGPLRRHGDLIGAKPRVWIYTAGGACDFVIRRPWLSFCLHPE